MGNIYANCILIIFMYAYLFGSISCVKKDYIKSKRKNRVLGCINSLVSLSTLLFLTWHTALFSVPVFYILFIGAMLLLATGMAMIVRS